MKLSEQQLSVVEGTIRDLQYMREITIAGMAGTGKTTIASTLLNELKNRPYVVLTPTGKAANVLRSKGVKADTIHSAIYNYKGKYVHADSGVEYLNWEEKGAIEKEPEIIFIDEASMVDERLANDLRSLGTKIIWVGDHGQLPPVGKDPGIMKYPNYLLKEVFRQKGNTGLLSYAYDVRSGVNASFKNYENVTQLKDKSFDELVRLDFDQAICGFNNTRHAFNRSFRQKLKYKKIIEPGEKMICVHNNRRQGIFNGMQFIVQEVLGFDLDSIVCNVIYDGDTKVREIKISRIAIGNQNYDTEKSNSEEVVADYAYCITCHKSQGSEWNKILVINQNSKAWDQHRWLYTAATRARESLIILN